MNYQPPYVDGSEYCSVYYSSNNTKNCQEEFFNSVVLQDTFDFTSGIFSFNWPLLLAFFLSWTLVYIGLFKSTDSAGKMSYILSTLPYICLTALLIGVSTKEGSWSVGVAKYFTFNAGKFVTLGLWRDAITQVFYSQGMAWGTMIAYASHNDFRYNNFSISWKVSIINALTSLYGGFVVFGTLGFIAREKFPGEEITDKMFKTVAEEGQKLAFVIYPAAIGALGKWQWIWGVVFFLMLISLGMGSQIGTVNAIFDGFMDEYKWLAKNKKKFLGMLISAHVFLGLVICTKSGAAWLKIYDYYCSFLIINFAALFEVIAVAWFYGIDQFITDVELMIWRGKKEMPLKKIWRNLWFFVTPTFCLLTGGISALSLSKSWMLVDIDHDKEDYGGKKGQYVLANAIGWLIPVTAWAVFVFYFVKNLNRRNVEPKYFSKALKNSGDEERERIIRKLESLNQNRRRRLRRRNGIRMCFEERISKPLRAYPITQ